MSHLLTKMSPLFPRGRFFAGLATLLAITYSAPGIWAQGCTNLLPSGGDDWAAIDNCLKNPPFKATLADSATPFSISKPIVFYASGSQLNGAGKQITTIVAAFPCGQAGPVIDANGQSAVRDSITITQFKLDLINIGSGCAAAATPAVRFIRSNNGEVSRLVVKNGYALSAGIQLVKSANILVTKNKVLDFPVGEGIAVEDSASAMVIDNTVNRTDFGIIVRNNRGAGAFDSSGSSVMLNIITDTYGRAMKLQASQQLALQLRNLVVTDNTATGFGNTGLYLVGGVTKARIENNYFSGAASSSYALWVGTSNPNEPFPGLNPSYDNTIRFNTFMSNKKDVSFNGTPTGNNAAGPDQPDITRLTKGPNTIGTHGIEQTPNTGICGQYAHAFWAYKFGLSWVNSGNPIILAAAGTYPGTRVTYHIRTPANPTTDLMSFTTLNTTASNCVLNQVDSPAITLAPGLYDVYVDLVDGNARYPDPNTGFGISIPNWKLSVQLDVR